MPSRFPFPENTRSVIYSSAIFGMRLSLRCITSLSMVIVSMPLWAMWRIVHPGVSYTPLGFHSHEPVLHNVQPCRCRWRRRFVEMGDQGVGRHLFPVHLHPARRPAKSISKILGLSGAFSGETVVKNMSSLGSFQGSSENTAFIAYMHQVSVPCCKVFPY